MAPVLDGAAPGRAPAVTGDVAARPKLASIELANRGGAARVSCSGGRSLAGLFDHLVGAKQDRWGHRKTQRLGGHEVHDHLKFCRKLHRKIARFFATHDAIHIGGGSTIGSTRSTP
jgi:hypothetical protein